MKTMNRNRIKFIRNDEFFFTLNIKVKVYLIFKVFSRIRDRNLCENICSKFNYSKLLIFCHNKMLNK